MDIAALGAKLRSWRGNVAQFAYENFQFEPDVWQKEAFDAFPSQDAQKLRIALQACAGPGKTAVLAICGLNFLSCYGDKGQYPKGAAVSMTKENLRDNLWSEFALWMGKSPFLSRCFTWTKSQIASKDHPESWFISARSWSKTANEDEQGRTLSGLHAPYVLYLIDESGDISPSVLRSAEQGLSNCKWGKIMQAGNPTSHDGMLYAVATSLAHQWYSIKITGDPDDPRRSPKIKIEWAREQIETHGRDNPWVMAYILGQFPPTAVNVLLSPDEVDLAMSRHLRDEEFNWSQKRLGIDVARFGDDRTTLCPRQGLAWFMPVELRHNRSHDIAARVAAAKETWGQEMNFIDTTGGWGSGVEDALYLGHVPTVPVNFSGKAIDARYFNKRSEIWWLMAQAVKRGAALPKIAQLKRELTTPRYWYDAGKLRLEEKDQIKARLKFSPDLGDGYACTYALPEQPSATLPDGTPSPLGGNVGKVLSSHDDR